MTFNNICQRLGKPLRWHIYESSRGGFVGSVCFGDYEVQVTQASPSTKETRWRIAEKGLGLLEKSSVNVADLAKIARSTAARVPVLKKPDPWVQMLHSEQYRLRGRPRRLT